MDTNTTSPNEQSAALRPGEKLGPYEVIAQVGSGGMGIVWRAHDRLLGRDVAVKQIAAAEAADELTRQRFRQEGELQKALSQQCDRLVEVIEVLNDARGLFIVMEYVPGPSLEQALAQHRDPIEPVRVLALVRDVAKALAAMHGGSVVHRDLKPGNILLAPEGAKVGDFGLAALVEQQEALPMGTAAYMAPELFGDGPVDGRADIYALGLIAYEMLIGRTNYEQAFRAVLRDKRNRAVRWMKWHTNVRARPVAVSQHVPNVSPLLADLVDRMMAKELSRRIQSAEQLLEIIERHFARPATPTGAGGERPQPSPQAVVATHGGPPAQATANGGPAPRPMPMNGGAPQHVAAVQEEAAAEEGDDATAPLPKRSRLVPVLMGVMAFNLLLLGGLYVFDQYRKGEAETAALADANEQFEAAMTAFDAGRFDEAQQQWEQLAETWDNHVQFGVGAEAYALLASAKRQTREADEAMTDNDYETALEAYNAATAAISRADDLVHENEATRVAASRLIRRIQSAQSDVPNRAAFVREARVIVQAMDDAKFDTARQHHRDLRRTLTARAGALTSLERRKLGELGTMIEDQAVRHEILEVDRRAQRLIEQGDLEEAQEILDEAQQRFEDHQLRDRLTEVTEQISFTSAMAEAEAAIRKGELRQAASALDRAYGLDPSSELADRLAQTRSDAALHDGREAEARGDLEQAARFLIEAMSHRPNEEAQRLLARVQGAGEVDAIVEAAEEAERAGDFEQAVNLYRRALRVVDDARTEAKLNAALVLQHASEARAALGRGDLEAGRAALAEARKVNREHEEVKQLQDRLSDYEAIAELREEGERMREASRFGPAKAAYRKAIARAEEADIDAEELTERHVALELEHLIAQARGAIQAERWTEARAYLQTAQRMQPSDVVDELLREVQQRSDGEDREDA